MNIPQNVEIEVAFHEVPKKMNSQFITITLAEHSSKWKQSSSPLQAEPVNDDDDQGFKIFNLMKFILKKLAKFSQKNNENWLNLY